MGRLDAEVVVVGAGPAGAATALLLARAGRDVALLDRAAFPRPKACGDCLSPGAGPLLERLGVLPALEAASPALLERWRIVAPGGAEVEAGFGPAGGGDARGLALPRSRLDALLVEAAVAAGARLLERHHAVEPLADRTGRATGVRVRASDGERSDVLGPLLVVADGLSSSLARRLGLAHPPGPLRKVSLTAHVRGVRGDGSTGELHVGAGVCAGLAPVGRRAPGGSPDDVAWNVTVVADAARHGGDIRADPGRFFRETLERLPGVRGRVPRDEPLGPLLAAGPFQRPVRRLATDGAALVGDAAGYYDPFTGQGIYHALAGAERLAEVAHGALRRGAASARALAGYAGVHRRTLAEAHLLQRAVEAVISRPGLCERAVGRLGRAPAFSERLLAATGDLARARSLLAPLPLLAFLTSHPDAAR